MREEAHCSIYSHVHLMKSFDKTVIIDGNEGSIRLGELSSNLLDGVKCKMCPPNVPTISIPHFTFSVVEALDISSVQVRVQVRDIFIACSSPWLGS